MNLEIASFENTLDKNSLFFINDSTVVFESNGGKVNLYLDQITNVRVIKSRNLTLNLALLVSSIFFYLLGGKLFFSGDKAFIIISFFIFLVSVFLRRFSCKLLINRGKYDFYEFVISKKNLHFAEHLASVIKAKKQSFNL